MSSSSSAPNANNFIGPLRPGQRPPPPPTPSDGYTDSWSILDLLSASNGDPHSSSSQMLGNTPNHSTSSNYRDQQQQQQQQQQQGLGKIKKPKKFIRAAGGTTWEDPSLAEWDSEDYRVFCGDLGNDVTDDLLTKTFNKYPSFVKARVVREKRTNASKGYGFISFRDPGDYARAIKDWDGKYLGCRPIKLRKSVWKDRSIEVRKTKMPDVNHTEPPAT